MNGEAATIADAATKAEAQARQRSTIAFPYMDLKSAIELAQAIHDNVGHGDCSDDQLAAWSGQSPKSSTFRVQVYAARTFGLLEGEANNHRLSELGRGILDPNQAREAKVRAFLNVALYRAVFENHKGGVLPPAAALEREMVGLGVSEKQKDRARQVFERAADQAGFFEHGRNRLVMPGVQRTDSPPLKEEKHGGEGGGGGSGGGSGGGPRDPLIAALIQKLPQNGPWTADERVMWLQMVAMAFQMAYGPAEPIEIKSGPRTVA